MKASLVFVLPGLIAFGLFNVIAQDAPIPQRLDQNPPAEPPGGGLPPFGPGGRGPGGPGGFGGPMMQEIKLVEKFDADGDGKLNAEERKAAREFLEKERAEGRLSRGFGPGGGRRRGADAPQGGPERADRPNGPSQPSAGGEVRPDAPPPPFGGPGGGFPPFGGGRNQPPAEPGLKLAPDDVRNYPTKPLYDPKTLRTLFLDFSEADWEKELADFKNTDVEVPAKLTVDGRKYKSDVGVHFRGLSSFMMVSEGYKRSLGVTIDYEDSRQDLNGYTHLDLLNSHEDASFLRPILYYQIAREYLPAPKANFVRIVINGESWGVYANVQHFNKEFTQEWYGTKKGARWKVPGNPGARGGLEYLGDQPEPYKSRFEVKSKDNPEAWADLINLCRVLNQTPAEDLVEKLSPILDIDEALRFLALDNALINNDGYWIRSSDYSIYEDASGQFHILPRDANETFTRPGGPGFGGGGRRGPGGPGGERQARPENTQGNPPGGLPPDDQPRPGNGDVLRAGGGPVGGGFFPRGPQVKGVELDPLVAANDPAKPLVSKLLAVPELRERYLRYVKDIAERWLDWDKLGPIAKEYAALITDDVKMDTRKLEKTEAFERSIDGVTEEGGPGREISLKSFAEQRRAYLLSYPAIQALEKTTPTSGAGTKPVQ